MKRAAIYARYSTDLQSERSVEDQLDLCRLYCTREGLSVVRTAEDRARSGASLFGREGLLGLMDAARDHAFDVVVVEALDRLSRDMEDLAGIHKRLSFLGIELRAVHEGRADTVMVGLRGLVGQLFREDGAKKVRRGLAGVVRDGRHAGGRAYGYTPVRGEKGRLAIVEPEAAVVRRIFADYAAGRVPRDIAGDLNREGVPPPRGSVWNASTINGNLQRGAGILLNEIYAGRIVWNKVRMIKDPDTGRRVSRVNPEAERMAVDAPELRIVDDATWRAAQEIKAGRACLPSAKKRRPAHLLSGLLRCGSCGKGMSIHDHDHTGRARIRCSAVRESGTCTNTSRFRLVRIEAAVLDGLREQLADPRLIEEYVRAYNDERRRLAAATSRNRATIEARAAAAERAYARTYQGYVNGLIDEEEAQRDLPRLRAERAQLRDELARSDSPTVVTLHPGLLARYQASLERLAPILTDHAQARDDRGPLVAELRELIHSVTVSPRPDGGPGFEIEVKGRLAQLIGGNAFPQNVGRRAVAEEGLEPPTPGL